MRKFTQHYPEWRHLYEDGLSTVEIGKRYDVDHRVVWAALKAMSVPRREIPEHVRHNELLQYHDAWVQLYNDKLSPEKIAVLYNVGKATVYRALLSKGVQMRSVAECRRKYVVSNEIAFDNIDTYEKAYWLGFLMADGNVLKRAGKKRVIRNVLQTQLSIRDSDHLYRLGSFLGTNAPLYNVTRTNTVVLKVVSEHLVDSLIRCGCIPNKTLVLEFPSSVVPAQHYNAFILGYLDGDGSVVPIKRRTPNHFGVRLTWACGSSNFANGLRLVLEDVVGTCNVHVYQRGPANTPICVERREAVCKLYHWFYDDATVWLPRKRERLEDLLGIKVEV